MPTWPVLAALALLCLLNGLMLWANHLGAGAPLMLGGALILGWQIYRWFAQILSETRHQVEEGTVEESFRQGMISLILSESFLFLSLLFSVVYVRNGILPVLNATGKPIAWPVSATNDIASLATLLLVTSSFTVRWANRSLHRDRRTRATLALGLTLTLGTAFLGVQFYEYLYTYYVREVSFSSGIYGALFFGITALHTLHVFLGSALLVTAMVRARHGRFGACSRFGFQGAAWYWHFVIAVWMGIYSCFYLV